MSLASTAAALNRLEQLAEAGMVRAICKAAEQRDIHTLRTGLVDLREHFGVVDYQPAGAREVGYADLLWLATNAANNGHLASAARLVILAIATKKHAASSRTKAGRRTRSCRPFGDGI